MIHFLVFYLEKVRMSVLGALVKLINIIFLWWKLLIQLSRSLKFVVFKTKFILLAFLIKVLRVLGSVTLLFICIVLVVCI